MSESIGAQKVRRARRSHRSMRWLGGALTASLVAANLSVAGASSASVAPPAHSASAKKEAVGGPNQAVVEDAYTYLSTSFPRFFANVNQGSTYELRRAQSLFTLALNFTAGDPNPLYRDRLVFWVKETLSNPSHMPDLHAGIDMRQQQYYLIALNLIWSNPDLRAQFDAIEQEKILLMGKAAVVSNAMVTHDYDASGNLRLQASRITMDGDPNCYPQGNPNWTEAILGSMIAGAYIMGLDQVAPFLNGYSHTAFTNELGEAGLVNVRDAFAATPADVVEGLVTTIDDNEEAGKPFFRGQNLSTLATNPFDFYHDAVASYTYTLNATEGDYIGQVGRAAEFQSTDAYGVRDAMSYALHGLNHSIGNRYLLTVEGDWGGSENSDTVQDLERRMVVGFSDVLGKATNGYWDLANGKQNYRSYTHDFYYPQFAGLATSLGLYSTVSFNDNFEDGDLSGWSGSGSWLISEEPTWSGSTTAPDRVVSVAATPSDAALITAFSGDSYTVRAPIRVSAWGDTGSPLVGLVGKYTDAQNYYFAGYNRQAGQLQIIRVRNGEERILAQTESGLTVGNIHQMMATFAADGHLELKLDGQTALSAKDKKHRTGSTGYFARSVTVSFDDFLVIPAH